MSPGRIVDRFTSNQTRSRGLGVFGGVSFLHRKETPRQVDPYKNPPNSGIRDCVVAHRILQCPHHHLHDPHFAHSHLQLLPVSHGYQPDRLLRPSCDPRVFAARLDPRGTLRKSRDSDRYEGRSRRGFHRRPPRRGRQNANPNRGSRQGGVSARGGRVCPVPREMEGSSRPAGRPRAVLVHHAESNEAGASRALLAVAGASSLRCSGFVPSLAVAAVALAAKSRAVAGLGAEKRAAVDLHAASAAAADRSDVSPVGRDAAGAGSARDRHALQASAGRVDADESAAGAAVRVPNTSDRAELLRRFGAALHAHRIVLRLRGNRRGMGEKGPLRGGNRAAAERLELSGAPHAEHRNPRCER